jgi:hypothetical protein
MVTLLPIEPRNEAHGALIVTAFNKLFINRGGQSDGDGFGYDYGYGEGDGGGDGGSPPEEWLVGP